MSSANHKVECTLILRRIYNKPVARVWRAWTDVNELGKWYVAGSDHIVHFAEADVRVGGRYRIGFGPKGRTPYIETGHYTEIVPLKRLAFEEIVSFEDKPIGGTENRLEFRDLGDGRTELILTCTGEEAWRSGEGWTPCFESLSRHLGEAA